MKGSASHTELLPVTQEDRNEAAAFVPAMAVPSRGNVLAGKADHLDLVQAFARHRIAATRKTSMDLEDGEVGASPASQDRATAVEPVPVSPLRDGIADALLALAARCEAAEGADRELDCRIFAALGPIPFETCRQVVPDFGQWQALPCTASLDAALTLVPEGWFISTLCERADKKRTLITLCGKGGSANGLANSGGATPALAICAAALRARASQEGST